MEVAVQHIHLQDWMELLVPTGSILLSSYVFLNRRKTIENEKRFKSYTIFWLLLSGTIHSFIEFSFVFFRNSFKAMDLYSASDFRYKYPLESGTAAMETITALLDGPLCFLAAYGFMHRKYWYHPVVLVLCTMQLYGLLWFCLHPLFTVDIQVAGDPVLFWVICVGMNAPWGIFPTILWWKSFTNLCATVRVQQKARKC